jgi:endo-1,4-beta-xylanase
MNKTLAILIIFLLLGCRKQYPEVCDNSSIYSHTSFPVGVAVDASRLQYNTQYRNIVISQFNSITGENAFKFPYVEPGPGQYDWTETDYIANFARQYGKRLHGHTLVWHMAVPGWLYNYTGNWDAVLQDHITQEVGRYKDIIHSWDVVNEGFNEDGTLRNSIWLQQMGTNYIQKAFEYAHAADPSAKLFYNDFNLESNPVKLKGVLDFLTKLKLSGVHIDGIGMQMHITPTYPAINLVADAAKKITDAGFLLHFSELDVNMNMPSGQTLLTESEQKQQADRYQAVFAAYNQVNPKLQFGITLWGISDADSWIPLGLPLLFDYNYSSKPAYCACKTLK